MILFLTLLCIVAIGKEMPYRAFFLYTDKERTDNSAQEFRADEDSLTPLYGHSDKSIRQQN